MFNFLLILLDILLWKLIIFAQRCQSLCAFHPYLGYKLILKRISNPNFQLLQHIQLFFYFPFLFFQLLNLLIKFLSKFTFFDLISFLNFHLISLPLAINNFKNFHFLTSIIIIVA